MHLNAPQCVRAELTRIPGRINTGPRRGRLTWAEAGNVETDRNDPYHIGASAHTNNTGELSAMHWMIERAQSRLPNEGREVLWSDSLYAINMTTGKWMPKRSRNSPMIAALRLKWKRLQRARPEEVHIAHVRSHIKTPGNELADWLAEKGTQHREMTIITSEATEWLREWCGRNRAGEAGGERAATARGPNTLGDPVGVG